MAFPNDALIKRGLSKTLMSRIQNLWPWGMKDESSSKDDLVVPDYDEIHQNCFTVYLDTYKEIISSGQFSESFSIEKVVQDVKHIYDCLLQTDFTANSGPCARSIKVSMEQPFSLQKVHSKF